MCFKKKIIESNETKLLNFINDELSNKERHICFKFGEIQSEFKFCGFYASYYYDGTQDFDHGRCRIHRIALGATDGQ